MPDVLAEVGVEVSTVPPHLSMCGTGFDSVRLEATSLTKLHIDRPGTVGIVVTFSAIEAPQTLQLVLSALASGTVI